MGPLISQRNNAPSAVAPSVPACRFNGAADFSAEQHSQHVPVLSTCRASMGPLISQRNNRSAQWHLAGSILASMGPLISQRNNRRQLTKDRRAFELQWGR